MSEFSIDDFRSHLKKSYHRTAHYKVEFGIPIGLASNLSEENASRLKEGLKSVEFDIETASLPGIALGTLEDRRYGFGPYNLKPYTPIFDVLQLTVRSDSEGLNYDFFQSWMKLILNFDVRNGIDVGFLYALGSGSAGSVPSGYEVSYKNDYASIANINVYDEEGGEPTTSIQLLNAYPIHLGNVGLDWSENRIMKFPVTITFASWMPNNKRQIIADVRE